jgi:hypothetical protein
MPLERAIRTTVPADEAVILTPRAAPWSLSVSPGEGGTVAVAVTVSDPEDPGAVWHALDEAPLAAPTLYLFPGPVAGVRVTAADAVASAELMA